MLAEEGFTHRREHGAAEDGGRRRISTRAPHAADERGAVLEVPPLVADRFGQVMPMGWGWGLRMSSPRRVLRAIEAANRAGASAVLTVHPWELDPDPPRSGSRSGLHFAHYFRLSGFRDRLREVLAGATFGRIGDVVMGADYAESMIQTSRPDAR